MPRSWIRTQHNILKSVYRFNTSLSKSQQDFFVDLDKIIFKLYEKEWEPE